MQFTNHNSNRFMPTTDDLGQSLINDGWTIANKIDLVLCRWQKAADNGYGHLPLLGTKTEAAIELLDDVCLTIGQYAAKGWSWWQRTGKDQAAELGWTIARGVALVVMLLACLCCVAAFGATAAWRWVRRHGAPGAVRVADMVCRFLLCYEDQGQGVKPYEVPVLDLSAGQALVDWSVARWPQLLAGR